MDAPSLPKSRGLRFAEQQMQRHGWSEGKGLGKREDGISEAIKVKVKCDTAGVGHNSAEQFTFHWWDHVFNKTASSISVEPDQDGVKVKKLSEEAAPVSSKKPRKAMLSRDMLYGRFIKSATLTSGGEKPVQESSSSSSDASDSSDDEDSKLDLSSAAKLSDETLMKVCGGRTAHKGARHGLTMSAKLSRIEEQERAFMEKYGKKETKQPAEEFNGNDKKRSTKIRQKEGNAGGEERDDPSEVPKKKKKRRKEELEEDAPNGHGQEHVPSTEEDAATSRKRRSKASDNIDMADEAEVLDKDKDTRRAKKKNKRRKEEREELEEDAPNGHEQEHVSSMEEDAATLRKRRSKGSENIDMADEAEVLDKDKDTRRSKKKNKEEREELEEDAPNGHEQEHVSSMEEDAATSRKRRSKVPDTDMAEVLGDQNDHLSVEEDTRQAKKKQKRRKEDQVEEDSPNSFGQAHVPSMEEDVVTLRRKKKSKVSDNKDMDDETEVLDDHKNDTRRAKKKEKRKTEREESVMSNCYIDNGVHHGHEMTGEEARTSKKKKKERRAEDGEESVEVEEQTRNHNETMEDEEHGGERAKRKKKRKDDKDEPEDGEDKVAKKKKKSKSRD